MDATANVPTTDVYKKYTGRAAGKRREEKRRERIKNKACISKVSILVARLQLTHISVAYGFTLSVVIEWVKAIDVIDFGNFTPTLGKLVRFDLDCSL